MRCFLTDSVPESRDKVEMYVCAMYLYMCMRVRVGGCVGVCGSGSGCGVSE